MTLSRSTAMILLAVAMAVPVFAQDTRGRVQGSVVDETEGTLPGVSLTLQNDATGVAVTRVSGGNGRYVFDQVDPGIYTLTAELEGFASLVQKNVRVSQRGDVTVDMVLRVSDVAETVTVEASPVAVQFNTSHRDLTIEQSFIKEMPIATRNAATLAILDPSVNGDFDRSSNVDHYAGNAYDIGGRTKGQNDILIDGSPLANSAKLGYNPPIETVAEYTVIQNAVDAEYGHSAGGIVTMAMKSGTNEIHGSGYYFGGDPDWNALTDRINQRRSPNTFWNGGATLGMPLIRNKLFLFSAFERQNDESFGALSYTVPTARERMGDFSQSVNADGSPRIIYDPMTSRIEDGQIVRDPFPGNVIPRDRWDPLAERLLQNLWDPNDPGDDLTGLNNYRYDNLATFRYWNFSNRIDWQINDRWKTFARYSFFVTDQDANDYLDGADTLKMRRTEGSQRDGFNFAADANYTINATTMLSVSGSYYKTVDRRNFPEMNIGEEGYRDLWPAEWWSSYMPGRPLVYFPNIQVVPTDDTFGVRNFWWQQPWGSSVGGKLIKHFGSHAVKAGANVRWKRGNAARFFFTNLIFTGELTRDTASGGNRLAGNPWADFLLGAMDPEDAVRGLPTSTQFIPLQEANTEMYALYLQDDFKINSRLTLNLGLRYEYEGGYWDSQYRLPQRLDLNDPIPGMQEAIAPIMASTPAGNTGKAVAQLMAESTRQNSHIYNGAFYYTEEDNRRATSSDPLQLMPRVGLAYRLDDKTAIRVGYGRFYTPPALTDSGNEPLGQYDLGSGFAPITNGLPLSEGRPQAFLSDPFPQGLTPIVGKAFGRFTSLGDNVTIDQYERRPPISDRITLSVQREIWGRTVVDVTYLMNFARRNLLTLPLNMMDPRLAYTYQGELDQDVPNPFFNYGSEDTFPGELRRQPTVSLGTLLRPYPQYGDIAQTSSDVGARYRFQSLQFRLQRPFHNGVVFLLSYAYNREKSEQFYDEVDTYDRVLTWQESTSPRHRVVASASLEIPVGRDRRFLADMPNALDLVVGGWQLSGTYWYRSGEFLRFDGMLAPESVRKIGGTGSDELWFDTSGFDRLPAYTRRSNPWQYGSLTGPSFSNLDAVISKRVSLPGGTRLEFRLEAYNALNQMVWANPTMSVTSSDFGRTNAHRLGNLGRRLQYALRLEF